MAVGIDFGTTNTALALSTARGVRYARYTLGADLTASFRSVLFFDPESSDVDGTAGVDAITEYLAAMGEGRLIQSIKTYLASELFESTIVRGKKKTVEALVARILSELWRHAQQDLGLSDSDRQGIVMGCPVNFAGGAQTEAKDLAAQNALASQRLLQAAEIAGFGEVTLVYEPIAAAFHYESTLQHEATVLVADFGGGTTDFSVMRMGPQRHSQIDRRDDILASGGVGIAGDNFDAKLIRHVVSPHLGMGTTYTEMGSTTEIPRSIYHQVERWHHLSFLKGPKVMRSLERMMRGAQQPEALKALMHLVEWNQGFHLHECVEQTKVALSAATEAVFLYEDEPVRIEATVRREDFEVWIAPEVAGIATCLDDVLSRAGLDFADVDQVFMTGGTSFVPAVRALFEERFGVGKLRGGDELLSIASGLALHARLGVGSSA